MDRAGGPRRIRLRTGLAARAGRGTARRSAPRSDSSDNPRARDTPRFRFCYPGPRNFDEEPGPELLQDFGRPANHFQFEFLRVDLDESRGELALVAISVERDTVDRARLPR